MAQQIEDGESMNKESINEEPLNTEATEGSASDGAHGDAATGASADTLVASNGRLLVVDGHSLAFRAFFALPVDNFSTSWGQPTNAVWGFAKMLSNVIATEKPTHIGVAFDMAGGTFRQKMLQIGRASCRERV